MSILEDLTALLPVLDVPMETGVFSNMAPDQYLVIVPLSDSFDLHADNEPGVDIQEARLSLYSKGSYTAVKNRLVRLLVQSGYTITDRQYLGFEPESGYHHYTVDVALSGGSGKASVESPALLTVRDGEATAAIVWSSSNYDFMMVGGEKLLPVNETGNSAFEIPVAGFDSPLPVQADTTAMSQPYLIDYTLLFDSATIEKAP